MFKRLMAMLFAFGLMVGLSAGATTAQAASICKGMSNGQCGGESACYWVDSYKTKKGTKVKAHCRAKPNGGAAKAKEKKASVKKASTKKTTSEAKTKAKSKTKSKTKSKSIKKDNAKAKSTKKDKAKSKSKTKSKSKDKKKKKAKKKKSQPSS